MPFEIDYLSKLLKRLERAGVIDDPAGTSRYMLIRGIADEKRKFVMNMLHSNRGGAKTA